MLDPIQPGLDKDSFFERLQREIESATARLVAEGERELAKETPRASSTLLARCLPMVRPAVGGHGWPCTLEVAARCLHLAWLTPVWWILSMTIWW